MNLYRSRLESKPKPSSIVITKRNVPLTYLEPLDYTVTITPSTITDPYTVTSSDDTVLTVDSNNVVQATEKAGIASLTVTCNDVSTQTSIQTLMLPYFANYCSAVLNNEIHIFGGHARSESAISTKRHAKWNGTSWIDLTNTSSYIFKSEYYQNKIHCIDSNGKHRTFDGTNWSTVGNAPVSSSLINMCVCNNELYLFYMNNGVKHYKWNGSTWTAGTDTNQLTYVDCNLVTYNNAIHAMSDNKLYKLSNNTWSVVSTPSIPSGLNSYDLGVINGKLHLVGGQLNADDSQRGLYHYVWNGTSWSTGNALKHAYIHWVYGQLQLCNNVLYAFDTGNSAHFGSYSNENMLNMFIVD